MTEPADPAGEEPLDGEGILEAARAFLAENQDSAVLWTSADIARLCEVAAEVTERVLAVGDARLTSAAIGLLRRMIALADPVHSDGLPPAWSNLGLLLQACYEIDGVMADLDEAVDACRLAADLESPGTREQARYLSNLSALLYQRGLTGGSERDREEALALSRAALDLIEPGDADRAKIASNWGISILRGFEEVSGSDEDLTAAINAFNEALGCARPDDRGAILCNIGIALLLRAERTGSAIDLEAGVRAFRDAVAATPARDRDRGKRLYSLSTALRTRFLRTQRDADLAEAIETGTDALELLGPKSPDRPWAQFALGHCLAAKFAREGDLSVLDACIELFHRAVEEAKPWHGHYPQFAGSLGELLNMRYHWHGAVADLDTAIELSRSALDAAPDGNIYRPMVMLSMAKSLSDRAASPLAPPGCSRQDLLDQSVAQAEAAVAAFPPGHNDRGAALLTLSAILRDRARLTGSGTDLDTAILRAEEGVESSEAEGTGVHDAARARQLADLSRLLLQRAELTGSGADLAEALARSDLALQTVPAEHPIRADLLLDAARCLRRSFAHAGKWKALFIARDMCLAAAETKSAIPATRIIALRLAAELTREAPSGLAALSKRKQVRQITALLEAAVILLPEVAPRRLARPDQQREIGTFAGLAAEAASYALADERFGETRAERAGRALRLLEHGRGILLSQALDTHTDLTDLRLARPDLAARYERLRELLDEPSGSGPSLASGEDPWGLPRPGLSRAQVAKDFADLTAAIRGLDGFADFMSPPPMEVLTSVVASGVIVFNVSSLRCDAILVKDSGPVDYVPLPLLTLGSLTEKVERFRELQELRMGRLAGAGAPLDAEGELLDILDWLWDVAARPALDALHFDGRPHPWGLYEVKWIPGGLLGQLPIHAAGRHRGAVSSDGSPVNGADGRLPPTVMDRVISSYAPTLRALHRAHGRAREQWRDQPERSLLIAALPGMGAAEHTLLDVLPGVTVLMPPGEPVAIDPALVSGNPSKKEVLDRLADCDIVHFLCHGETDPVDPSRSRLLLGTAAHSEPLTVAELASVRLGAARLAYLSACSTARNQAAELADESIHLSAAFQLAGFPYVIGTLWEVDQVVAANIASEFYRRLRDPRGFLDVNQAATVLHGIIRDLRGVDPGSPFAWAAYLHVGR